MKYIKLKIIYDELYAYKGDPDDLNTFSFKRIQNK